ncbi:MAG TPA: oligogalacturonate lyase family protein [Phycisphaerae bacterium]|nr:oligogalacturonate lyase family protein [Phycisphaerae bacterium]
MPKALPRFLLAAAFLPASAAALAQHPASQPTQGRDPNTGSAFNIRPSDGNPPPKEWTDPDTGHRVVRLSDEPNSLSLYFHQYAYSPDGKELAFTSPTGIYQVNLDTRKISQVLPAHSTVDGQTVANNIIHVGRKTGRIFLTRTVFSGDHPQAGGYAVSPDHAPAQRSVWWIDPLSKQEHKIGDLPPNYSIGTVNCDETLLAGAVTYLDGRNGSATQPVRAAPGQRINLAERWAQHLPMALITMDASTGKITEFNPSNDWDNHFQFSPTDPHLLMYCHEGPWQNNDRVWTINTDGSNLTKIHARTMINEIWGHEFWAPDGSAAWYQLNTPRGVGGVAWIANTNLKTHAETWYHLEPGQNSIHVNISPDGKLLAGDGGNGDPWILLHTPHLARNLAAGVYDTKGLVQPGYFDTEKLVNMSKHQYALEPNVNFTPDNKWIVFRSNMFGPSYVFEVQVAKSTP